MARSVFQQQSNANSGLITRSSDMPISGVFGTGKVMIFSVPGVYEVIVPEGITAIRSRLWGGGGKPQTFQVPNPGFDPLGYYITGAGAGFSIKENTNLVPGSKILVTVAGPAGTSSFGNFHSATGPMALQQYAMPITGTYWGIEGGIGIGGDINHQGGAAVAVQTSGNASYLMHGGSGAANLLGDGGSGGIVQSGYSSFPIAKTGTSGFGGGSYAGSNSRLPPGNGVYGKGGNYSPQTINMSYEPAEVKNFSIDFIGCGGGGGESPASNGGGGGTFSFAYPGWPGGGSGTLNLQGAHGLVILEL